jgi:hypothetical protein
LGKYRSSALSEAALRVACRVLLPPALDISIESEAFLHLLVAAVRCNMRDLRQSWSAVAFLTEEEKSIFCCFLHEFTYVQPSRTIDAAHP